MAWSWCVPFGLAGRWCVGGLSIDLLLGGPNSSSASVPEWLERHQFLHTQSRLATQHQHVQARREVGTEKASPSPQPHFMFNALTSVHWLAAEGRWKEALHLVAFKASGTSTGTSRSLRSIPSRRAGDLGGLRRVGIHPTGQGRHLLPPMHPAVPSCAQIPALLLQPALENALWHGFDDSVERPRCTSR